jgi:protein disulfide-isomerase A1
LYRLWCSHTNNAPSLEPKYVELAALYANNPDFADKVTIAKVDATLNDVPDEIQGFPTIKLFPAGGKDAPLDYSGSRTIEDLANFVKEKGKYQIDAYVAPEAEDSEMPDADKMGKAAPAASKKAEEAKEAVKDAAGSAKESAKSATYAAKDTKDKVVDEAGKAKEGVKEKAKSKVSEAAEAVKTMAADSDEGDHDEL